MNATARRHRSCPVAGLVSFVNAQRWLEVVDAGELNASTQESADVVPFQVESDATRTALCLRG